MLLRLDCLTDIALIFRNGHVAFMRITARQR